MSDKVAEVQQRCSHIGFSDKECIKAVKLTTNKVLVFRKHLEMASWFALLRHMKKNMHHYQAKDEIVNHGTLSSSSLMYQDLVNLSVLSMLSQSVAKAVTTSQQLQREFVSLIIKFHL